MFRAFCERPTVGHVARTCHVATMTVRRYRKWEDWDDKFEAIKRKAQAKLLQDAGKVMGIHQGMHVEMAQKAAAALKKKRLTAGKVTAKMLDTLARTGSFLFEDEERRPDQVIRIDFGAGVAFSPSAGKRKKKLDGDGEGKRKVDVKN